MGVSSIFRHSQWYFKTTWETTVYWDNQKYMLVITYTVNIENVMILKLLFHINPRADDPGFHLHTLLVDYVTPFFSIVHAPSVLVGYTMSYHPTLLFVLLVTRIVVRFGSSIPNTVPAV